MAWLGVDTGTQSTKAVVYERGRGVIGRGAAPHTLDTEGPPGTCRQDPCMWLSAAITAVRQAVEDSSAAEIEGLAVSGQQHGLVALDRDDRPVSQAPLWNDTTSAPQAKALEAALGGRDRWLELVGNRPLPGYTAPKVAQLVKRDPDAYRRVSRVGLPHDFLNLWLTGDWVTEPGDASGTAYFDIRRSVYSEPVLSLLDSGRDWNATLPRVRPSLSIAGFLRREAAQELRLRPGTPVTMGSGDNMAAAIGVAATPGETLVISLGTSGTAFATTHVPAVDPLGEAAAFCDSTGHWMPLVCTQNVTLATSWILGLTGRNQADLDTALESTAPGAGGVTFLPYLTGERTPDLPNARGSFVGLRTSTSAADAIRAVVEGVTFGLVESLEALSRAGVEFSRVTLVGGGSYSDGWTQLLADVLRMNIERPRERDAAALGMAHQAAHVAGGLPLADESGTGTLTAPRVADYTSAFERYRGVDAQLRPLMEGS